MVAFLLVEMNWLGGVCASRFGLICTLQFFLELRLRLLDGNCLCFIRLSQSARIGAARAINFPSLIGNGSHICSFGHIACFICQHRRVFIQLSNSHSCRVFSGIDRSIDNLGLIV